MARDPASARTRSGRQQEAHEHNVGQQLRVRREERSLSLRELARRLGISPSALSQIETGKSHASVSTLYAIVSELGMSLDELFGGLPSRDRAAEPVSGANAGATKARASEAEPGLGERVQRAGTRAVIDLESGVRWERLTARPDPDADFLYVTYDVGGSSSPDHFMRHSGREYGLVLSGELEVTVGFETHTLSAGDSISFDSTVPHRLRNVGSVPVHGVWFVIGRQADSRTRAFDGPGG